MTNDIDTDSMSADIAPLLVSREHLALLGEIREFYRLRAGNGETAPSPREVLEAALESLAWKAARFDYPEGAEDRTHHPLAGEIKQCRERVLRVRDAACAQAGKRLIWLA